LSTYLAIRIGHGLPAVLLLLGLIVHVVIVWRARKLSAELLQKKLNRTQRISLPLFALLTLSLPISGWWMTHLAGMPLSQKWLMLSIALLPLIFIFLGLLNSNLGRWQQLLAEQKTASSKQQVFALLWAVAAIILLLAISALMGAKPL